VYKTGIKSSPDGILTAHAPRAVPAGSQTEKAHRPSDASEELNFNPLLASMKPFK
jgi:hypothetical protein